ncbi:hypothetical protein AAG614_11835 [Citromicrobium bathyomarinum]
MKFSVAERGTSPVNSADWSVLSSDEGFWRLVDAGIVRVETRKAGGWQLRGTCYVGRSVIGDNVLEISEKFEGSLAKLLSLGAPKAPLVANAQAPVTPDAASTPLLILLFIRAARRYLSGHKRIGYIGRKDEGTLVGGRLDVRRTVRLHAKGMRHQAAFVRNATTADVGINRAIYAALRQVEVLSRTVSIATADLAAARALSTVLEECLPSVRNSPKGSLVVAATEASARYGRDSPVGDAASLAAAVLDSAGFGGTQAWTRTIERSWFVNLETQFEGAVRTCVKSQLEGDYRTDRAVGRPPLFPSTKGRYAANPDLVIRDGNGAVAIADAKYKELAGWPSASDIHELLCHASAYGAQKAFLVFPNESGFDSRHFGVSATGCDVWAFCVTFDDFEDDIRSALAITGLKLTPTSERKL